MRRVPLAFAVATIGLAVVAAVLLRPPSDVAIPSPLPTASPSAIASPSPTADQAASPTASPSPSPTPQGQYVSKTLGFALVLPPPWRKASCGNSDERTELPLFESFTSAPVMEEQIGHAGAPNDRIGVMVDKDPEGLTPTQYARRRSPNDPITAVTFAGRPAVEVRTRRFGEVLEYIFAEADRMYAISAEAQSSGAPDMQTMLAILRSFRLLTSVERQALPDPTPFPAVAPTAEALAGMLKTALEQKDIAAVDRLLGPCVGQGVQPGGGGSGPREQFVAGLRQQFAAGLTVTVDTSAINEATDRPPGTRYIWSKWNAFPPGSASYTPPIEQRTYNVRLYMSQTPGGWYWSAWVLVHTF